ncbi:MAG: hypothetical protein IMW99_06490 [Firmicutes bacterium]|nr:hypothetical protein [Bacillota bacterium]
MSQNTSRRAARCCGSAHSRFLRRFTHRCIPGRAGGLAAAALCTALALAVALALPLPAAAAIATTPDPTVLTIPEGPGVGAAALGMGGAVVAITADQTSAYWNPAGIAHVHWISIVPSLSLDLPQKESLPLLQDLLAGTDAQTLWEKYQGQSISVAGTGTLGLATTHVALSAVAQGVAQAQFPQNASDGVTTQWKAVNASTLTLAHSFQVPALSLARLDVGANIKLLQGAYDRTHYDVSGPGQWSATSDSIRGTGVAYDIGVQAQTLDIMHLGAVVRNLGATLTWGDAGPRETLAPVLALGVAVRPPLLGLTVAAGIDKPLTAGSTDLAGSDAAVWRLGVEQSVLGVLALRAGAYGTPGAATPVMYTGGLGLGLGPVRANVAVQTADFSTGQACADLSLNF